MVKADAYGLGVAAVAPCLYDAGCRVFFVAHLAEGIELRALLDDPAVEIFVFNGLLPGEEDLFRRHRLCPALNDLGQIERWSAFGGGNGPQPAAIHLDTGMSRLGLPPQELDILASDPSRLDGVALRCIMSHLACADTPNHPLNREQLHAFRAALPRLPNTAASLAASSGIFLGPDYHFDLVRPGVALYGVAPVAGEPNPMQQVINYKDKSSKFVTLTLPGPLAMVPRINLRVRRASRPWPRDMRMAICEALAGEERRLSMTLRFPLSDGCRWT